jgi:8-oxo-dGTP pyrophosphatase MutT (NUDIX family)
MKQEQAVRIQRELLRGSGATLNGEPFLTYGIWVLPFTEGGMGREVFLIDRPISSESDHQAAKREAAEKLGQAIARPVAP